MARFSNRNQRRLWRKVRIRKKISGDATKPRLCVFRSNRNIYVQAIDDLLGVTLATARSSEEGIKAHGGKPGTLTIESAEAVGKLVAERLTEKGIKTVVFDRGGFPFHGRVKALAEGARSAGLKF